MEADEWNEERSKEGKQLGDIELGPRKSQSELDLDNDAGIEEMTMKQDRS